MEQEQVFEEILKALDEQESTTQYLSQLLSSYAVGGRTSRTCAGALKHLSTREVGAEIIKAKVRGFVAELTSGQRRYYSITDTGVAFLRNRGVQFLPPQKREVLIKNLRHPDVKVELISAIKPWYDRTRIGSMSENSWWNLVEEFMNEQFQVFELKVNGKNLSMGYQRVTTPMALKKRSAKELLESLFKTAFVL